MENMLFKSRREIVEELIQDYVNIWKKDNLLYEAGIQIEIKYFNSEHLINWALDLIGFPQDTSLEKDELINGKSFFRDYLKDSSLLNGESANNKHNSVKEFVDFLYEEFENLKKENPQLFQ